MPQDFTLAVTGDAIINRRISRYTDKQFLSLIKIIQDTDVGFTHLETLIHDYDEPEIYPAAEAGWTWMRSPRGVVDDLKWAGFKMVSHASNHSLDYSYGGLYSTWKALKEADLPYAGTGRNLGEARKPAYLDTPKGRVALISMTSSFTGWAKAGDARTDLQGRPGLNPLRFYYEVDADTLDMVKKLAAKLGWVIENYGKTWLFNNPGTHMALTKFVVGDKPGASMVVDESDAEGNLRSIRDARRQADWVLVHLHNHEWDPEKDLAVPPEFVTLFARDCIDAGADAFLGQGSHAKPRGMEIYKKKPIFYDLGDFFGMSNTVERLPSDFFMRPGYDEEVRSWKATLADGLDARISLPTVPGGAAGASEVTGGAVAVCSFGSEGSLVELKLYPFALVSKPRSKSGIPMMAEGEAARKIIGRIDELSAPFGTKIEFKDGIGIVKI